MSLNSSQKNFFNRFDFSPARRPEPEYRVSSSGYDLYLDTFHQKSISGEANSLKRPIKVSDPILISENPKISDRIEIDEVYFHSDDNRSFLLNRYPVSDPSLVTLDNPYVFLSDGVLSRVTIHQKTSQPTSGLIPGLYKYQYYSSTSPTVQEIRTVRAAHSTIRVQGSNSKVTEKEIRGLYYTALPTPHLYGSFRFSDPETVAHGIYLAIAGNDEESLVGLLNTISDYYIEKVGAIESDVGYEPGDEAIPGFPYRLPRLDRAVSEEVWTAQNAFLGLAILDGLSYFYDKPLSEIKTLDGGIKLDKKLKFVVEQLNLLLSAATDGGNQFSSEVLSAEGFFLSSESLEASFLSSIYLTKALQLDYSVENHATAARLYLKLAELPAQPAEQLQMVDASDTDSLRVPVARAIWQIYFSLSNSDTVEIIRGFISRLQEKREDEKDDSEYRMIIFGQGFLQNIYPDFQDSSGNTLEESPIYDLPTNQTDGLYHYPDEIPNLVTQSAISLRDTTQQVFNNIPPFPLLAEEAILAVWQLYEEATRMLPVGRYWFQPEVLRRSDSTLVNLLLSNVSSTLSSILRYLLVEIGQDISSAVGFVLAKYASVYLPKPKLTSDTFWNQMLSQYLRPENKTIEEISETISSLLGGSVEVKTPEPYPYQVNESSTGWSITTRWFDPNSWEDLFSISKTSHLSEVIDLQSNYYVGDSSELLGSSNDLISQHLNETVTANPGSLDSPTTKVDSNQLLGYIETEGEDPQAASLIQDIKPAELYYRIAKTSLYRDNDRNRDTNTGITLTNPGISESPIRIKSGSRLNLNNA
jgi:hypothetical protein